MNNSTIGHTEINADVTKQELFKKLFLIFGQLFSLLQYPVGGKFLFDYAFIEDIKKSN